MHRPAADPQDRQGAESLTESSDLNDFQSVKKEFNDTAFVTFDLYGLYSPESKFGSWITSDDT